MTPTMILVNAATHAVAMLVGIGLGAGAYALGGWRIAGRFMLVFLAFHAVITAGLLALA